MTTSIDPYVMRGLVIERTDRMERVVSALEAEQIPLDLATARALSALGELLMAEIIDKETTDAP